MTNKNWPYYSSEEIQKVVKVLKSGKVNYWTGNYCKKFERLYAKKFNLNYPSFKKDVNEDTFTLVELGNEFYQ